MRDLSEVFLWVGIAGAALALLCAIVATVALAAGAAGITGGAVAVWIGGALLSLTSGFSGQWTPALAAAGALAAGLILGAIARPIVKGFERRPKPEIEQSSQPMAVPATIVVPATAPAIPAMPAVSAARLAGVHTVASESIR